MNYRRIFFQSAGTQFVRCEAPCGWVNDFTPTKMIQRASQCDQMARLFLQDLAIYNNGNLPKRNKLSQSGFTILPNTK